MNISRCHNKSGGKKIFTKDFPWVVAVYDTKEIHQTIVMGKLFKKGDRVAVASSGGKDSTVLGYVLKLLNERYDYGLNLELLSIDEGITGYRDDSLESLSILVFTGHIVLRTINFVWAIHQAHHSGEDFTMTSALRQAVLQPFTAWVFNACIKIICKKNLQTSVEIRKKHV
ncbi:hypothetical protein RND71_043672 [Anisodus tanguticus]|uniref:Uncharacterized protein n=1 Tax=Anisodus tanguticus TaxID=243964 RepID=A0AAE1ULU1_9SOLA|nr:hypothetical protein RND71_043672 [Anisodus tanguticus]